MPNGPGAPQRWPFHQNTRTLPASPVGLRLASGAPVRWLTSKLPRPALCTPPSSHAWLNASPPSRMGSLADRVDPPGTCRFVRRQRHRRKPSMARQADHETHSGPLAVWTEATVSVEMAPVAGCFTRSDLAQPAGPRRRHPPVPGAAHRCRGAEQHGPARGGHLHQLSPRA